MKARKFFAFVAAAGMLFAGGGCTPNEEEPVTSDPCTLTLNPESLAVKSAEQTVNTVELTSNGSWNIVVPEEHSDITVSPLNGNGNATLTITIPAHADRVVALSITATKKVNLSDFGMGVINDTESKTFVINQNETAASFDHIAGLVSGESATVIGVVSAVGASAAIVTDSTGSLVIYGYETASWKIGQMYKIEGTPSRYSGYDTNALQIALGDSTVATLISNDNDVAYNPTVIDGAVVDDKVGKTAVCEEIQFEGTLTVGQYANVIVEGATKQASLYYVNVPDYAIYDNQEVIVKGYVVGTYNYLNVLPYSVTTTSIVIKCDDILNVDYAGVVDATAPIEVLNYTGTITATCDGEIVTDASVDGNVLTYTVSANEIEDVREGWIKLSAEGIEDITVKVSQMAKGAYNFMSDTALALISTNTTRAYVLKAKANGSEEVNGSGFKLGTGSYCGTFVSAELNKTGDATLEFYACAWTGKNATLYIRLEGTTDNLAEIALVGNAGAAGSSDTYTITFADNEYHTVKLTGLTATTKLQFSTDPAFGTASDNSTGRALVVGAHIK